MQNFKLMHHRGKSTFMDNTNILRTDLLDLIFQGRNKEYGAYELRKNHDRYLKRAMLFALLAPLVIWAFTSARTNDKNDGPRVRITSMQTTCLIKTDELRKQDKPQLKKPETAAKAFVAQYHIMRDDSVKKTMASQIDLIDRRIDVVDIDGKKFTGIVDTITRGPVITTTGGDGGGEGEGFGKQEIDASFPGGDAKWLQYLERNANGQVATDNEAPPGTYTAVVQFVVDENGNVSDVRALTNNGYGIEEEAVRVIRKGPKWVPAYQNGHLVRSFRKQPITFRVDSE